MNLSLYNKFEYFIKHPCKYEQLVDNPTRCCGISKYLASIYVN
jgi:hypothetical protein